MKTTRKGQPSGRRLWLDGVTRAQLNSGALRRCIEMWPVTGLTFNPGVFADAIRNSRAYDGAIRRKLREETLGEALLFALALEDIGRTADLFRPLHDRTGGAEGWVSLEASPLRVHDFACTLAAVMDLHARAGRSNLYIKIPGTSECLPAVEEAIFAGVPVNVTLLFSREHYLAAADAFLRGIERRIASGLAPDVPSVVSMSAGVGMGCADVMDGAPDVTEDRLGMALSRDIYHAWRELLGSPRWSRAQDAGARPQGLVWVAAGLGAPEDRCTGLLAFPGTAVAVPEGVLGAFANHADTGAGMRASDGSGDPMPAVSADAGFPAGRLQRDAVASHVRSWIDLMGVIASRSAALAPAT